MKQLRHIIAIICIVASFIANAGEPLTGKAEGATNQPTPVELQPLQGTWEGFEVGDQYQSKITITVTGDSFHFHRGSNFWFETTITLPAGRNPKQLHATIKDTASSQADSIGKVVVAIFKIEGETLTLATGGEETPKNFEASEDKGLLRYELRRVQKKNTPPPKSQ